MQSKQEGAEQRLDDTSSKRSVKLGDAQVV